MATFLLNGNVTGSVGHSSAKPLHGHILVSIPSLQPRAYAEREYYSFNHGPTHFLQFNTEINFTKAR